MLKRFNLFLMCIICALFVSVGNVNAEEWLYQRMYLTSHHVMNYSNSRDALGRANLHLLEDVDSSSGYNSGDGDTRFTYCADVDAGGYAGTYVRRVLGDSEYNGNGVRLGYILASSYPYVSLEEMKALYMEQTGNSIDGLTYQEAIYATQAAIWTITNSDHAPYTYAGNMDDSEMLDLTHSRIGLHCDWSVTNPSDEGYCYPNTSSVYYETDEGVVNSRVSAVLDWLLSLDGSYYNGDININVISKEILYDDASDESISKVAFKVEMNNLITVKSLYSISLEVIDSTGKNIGAEYDNGVYYFEQKTGDREANYTINVKYTLKNMPTTYLYESSGQQDLVGVEFTNVVKDSSVNVSLSDFKTGDVQISKVAVTGGPEIAGAKLTIKDIDGNVIDSWVSGGEAHVVKGLKEGKYTLTEELAPEGYSTANTITFEISEGKVTTVEMIDEVTKVYISKKDCYNENIVGARFEVINSSGDVVETWISDSNPHYIEKLGIGKYTLVVTVYPNGYSEGSKGISSESTFEVKDTGVVQNIELIDKNVCKIHNVPNTGINKFIGFGVSIIIFGGIVIISSRKKEV